MGNEAAEALREVLEGLRQALARYATLTDPADVQRFPIIEEIRREHRRRAADIDRRLNAMAEPIIVGKADANRPHDLPVLRKHSSSVPRVLSFARETEAGLTRVYDGVLAVFDFHADRVSGRLLTSQGRQSDHLGWRLSREIERTRYAPLPVVNPAAPERASRVG